MRERVVVFSGAGMSAESGLPTFRGLGGLWQQYSVYQLATPEAWARDPALVQSFYNARREALLACQPNAAHLALARLESRFEVVIVTQNVDDLHERAGSSQVLHLHGELMKARSTRDPALIYRVPGARLEMGDLCEKGSQLRPHVVWFGEAVLEMDAAEEIFASAQKVLVVGTSLSVFPAAGLVQRAPRAAEKVLVDPDPDNAPAGYRHLRSSAVAAVPALVERWLSAA
jgi:NAD-dependent deacetylase